MCGVDIENYVSVKEVVVKGIAYNTDCFVITVFENDEPKMSKITHLLMKRENVVIVGKDYRAQLNSHFRGYELVEMQMESNQFLKRKKIVHGTNAFPPIPVEDDVSAEELVEEMKTEMKNPHRSISVIQLSMEKTYAYRRQLVNECAPVRVLLNKYPSLKMVEAISEEMCRVTGKLNLRETFDKNCTSYSTGLLELAKKKKTEFVKNSCKTLDDALNDLVEPNPCDVSRMQTVASIIQLADVLGEDIREFVHIYDGGTSDDVTEGQRTPHLAVIGSIYKPVAVHTVIEGDITCTVKTVLEAVYVTFCAYYIFNIEYPKAALNTWSFVQFVLCGIEEGDRPPKKVISLRGKLCKMILRNLKRPSQS